MVTFKGNMLTVSNPARVSPTFKIAITKVWYVQTFWNLFFNWSVYHLNSVLLLSVGLNLFLWAADLSTITVAPHEQWNDSLAVFKDSIFTKNLCFISYIALGFKIVLWLLNFMFIEIQLLCRSVHFPFPAFSLA